MELQRLDYILVPIGLSLMVAYHAWLTYMVVKKPTKTVVGINAINRRIWVRTMMEDPSRNGILAVQTLRNNIMASTLLASTAIMLCSLMAMLMTSNNTMETHIKMTGQFFDRKAQASSFDGPATGIPESQIFSLKSFSILLCFLVAFLMNVQSIRYYSHASILINVRRSQLLTPNYVAEVVNRGSYFWSIGLRAFYFSFPLFLWIFGPIPMFLCCIVLVSMLHSLDVSFHGLVGTEEGQEIDEIVGK